jgi:hypothetical protein
MFRCIYKQYNITCNPFFKKKNKKKTQLKNNGNMTHKRVILRMQKVLENRWPGAKLIADFRLQIADLNFKPVAYSKSEIRNPHSKILSVSMPRN